MHGVAGASLIISLGLMACSLPPPAGEEGADVPSPVEILPSIKGCLDRVTLVARAEGTQGGQELTWDFGDGAQATGLMPEPHGYPGSGTYMVTLSDGQELASVPVIVPSVDLVAQAVVGPTAGELRPGNLIEVTVTYSVVVSPPTLEPLEACPFDLLLVLSPGPPVSSADPALTRASALSRSPGTHSQIIRAILPDPLPPWGEPYLGLFVDPPGPDAPQGAIREEDEQNQGALAASPLPVEPQGGPRLQATMVACSPTLALAGDILECTFTIANQGRGHASSFDYSILLAEPGLGPEGGLVIARTEGVCRPEGLCAQDDDCPTGASCRGGACAGALCAGDQACPDGLSCLSGRCGLACEAGDACPALYSCAAGLSLEPGAETTITRAVSLPQGLEPGAYQIWLTLDDGLPGGRTAEEALAVVSPEDGPDLMPVMVAALPDRLTSGPLTLMATVRNRGAVDALTFFARVYLSRDSHRDDQDTLLGSITFPGLPGGAEQSLAQPGMLPAGLAPAPYALILEVDSTGAVEETVEDNNLLILEQALVVEREAEVDLEARSVSLGTARAAWGEDVAVSFLVQNRGPDPSPITEAQILLLGEGGLTSALGRAEVAALDGGAFLAMEAVGAVPEGLEPGFFTVAILVDPDDIVDEIAEENNLALALEPLEVVPGAEGCINDDPGEPNDGPDQAWPLNQDSLNGTICPGDLDDFGVALSTGTMLEVLLLHGQIMSCRLNVCLLAPFLAESEANCGFQGGGESRVSMELVASGVYVVEVRAQGAIEACPYELSLLGLPIYDPALAWARVPTAVALAGELIPYEAQVVNGGTQSAPGLVLMARLLPMEGGEDVSLVLADVGTLGPLEAADRSGKALLPRDLAPGEYGVEIVLEGLGKDTNRGNNALLVGEMAVWPFCEDDGLEPNDSLEGAVPLVWGLIKGLTICPFNDDVFALAASPGQRVRVEVEPSSQAGDLDLVVADQQGNILADDLGPQGHGNVEIVAPGALIITVQGFNGDSGPYSLRLEAL